MSFATVNVHHVSLVNKLQKLTGELLCQQNARGAHNNGLRFGRFFDATHGIKDHDQGFAATSGHNDLTKRVGGESIKGSLLVLTEFHAKGVSIQIVWHKKRGASTPCAS
jgi:hypothetical protein